MRVKKEVTRIKGGEKEEITIRLTRHGPLIDDVIVDSLKTELPRRAIAMRWAASELTSQFKTAHNALTRSKNINKFTDTFSLWSFPSAHLIVADNNGDMAYILGSGIPVRRGFDGSLPVPGWDGKYEWQGFVPPQQKPMCRNPGMGFINTSNSRQPVPHDYPHELGNVFFPPDRAARITEVIKETLGKNGEFRPQDVNRVYSDVHVLMAKRWIPLLLEALKGAKLSGNETRALEELSRWDCLSRKEAIAPMIFQSLLMRMIENSFAHRLGKELYKEYIESHTIALKGLRNVMASERSPWFDNLDTPAIEGRAEMLKKSFREAVQYLEARLGTDVGEWKLGKLLTLTFKHPFSAQLPFLRPFIDVGPYPMSGGFIVPYQTSYKIAEPFAVEGLSTARHVLDLSDRRKAMAVTIPGISGNFMSPHYDDQVDMWYSFKFRPLMLYRDQVENDARYRMKLLPKK